VNLDIDSLKAIETVGVAVGTALTLLIFSYLLWGNNRFYRLALYLFIGAVVGNSFGIALLFIREVLRQLGGGESILVFPLILGILLLIKGFPRHAYIGNFSVAYLVGVGTAAALSGALLGTLVPQVGATGRALSDSSHLADGLLVVVGTVCTLMAFNFAAPKRRGLAGAWAQVVGAMAWIGRWFLVFAFGVALAGVLTASLSIFIGRIQYVIKPLVDLYIHLTGG